MTGWSSEMPFWARRLGSIPSTLKTFLAVEGDTIGLVAFEFGETDGEKRYLRFFWRKTGYTRVVSNIQQSRGAVSATTPRGKRVPGGILR
jgi:hypothetical protein